MKKLSGLYAITNETLMPEAHFIQLAEAAISSGIGVLQYRDKSSNIQKRQRQASALKKLCDQHGVIFIINDDINLAQHVNADGVHIGKHDVNLKVARKQLGEHKIIGISCYNQLSLAKNAVNHGANYIAFGRFFDSSIKPDAAQANTQLIAEYKKSFSTPLCCIGGITHKNYAPLVQAGTDMYAVISDVFREPTSAAISLACRQFT